MVNPSPLKKTLLLPPLQMRVCQQHSKRVFWVLSTDVLRVLKTGVLSVIKPDVLPDLKTVVLFDFKLTLPL